MVAPQSLPRAIPNRQITEGKVGLKPNLRRGQVGLLPEAGKGWHIDLLAGCREEPGEAQFQFSERLGRRISVPPSSPSTVGGVSTADDSLAPAAVTVALGLVLPLVDE